MPKQEMLWKVVRKRTNEDVSMSDRWEDDSQKKGDPNDPWMDWCLGTISWTLCEDWHLSHCNSRTVRPISKSLSTSIWRKFEWTTFSVKTWEPGSEKCIERYAGGSGEKMLESNSSQQVPGSDWMINFVLIQKGSSSGLSTNWDENFADEKPTLTDQPSSLSSSWSQSSSWWDSPSWTQTGTHGTSAIGKTISGMIIGKQIGQDWNALSSSFEHQATGSSGFIKNFKLFENNEFWQSSWVVFL